MNNEPEAWMRYSDKAACSLKEKRLLLEEEGTDWGYKIPLYTHPAKTIKNLTDEEINQVAIDMGMFGDLSHDEIELYRNLLRKAQEK